MSADLLVRATAFSWDATPDNAYPDDRGIWSIDIARMRQEDGSFRWARWTLEEALAEAERILPIYREERRVQVQRHRDIDEQESPCP